MNSLNLHHNIHSYLEFNVTAERERTERTLDAHHRVAVSVLDRKRRTEYGPLLLHRANQIARRCRHFHCLQTAREAARRARQRPMQMDDGVAVCVHHLHLERSGRTAAVTRAAVVLLDRPVDFLAETVLDRVLVVRLEAGERLQQFDLLLDKQLVNSSKILQTRRAMWNALWNIHPPT